MGDGGDESDMEGMSGRWRETVGDGGIQWKMEGYSGRMMRAVGDRIYLLYPDVKEFDSQLGPKT